MFVSIYGQAHTAEQLSLDQVCGPGYRKALEFLLKDFLIGHTFKSDPTKHDDVKKAFLANVIKEQINDSRIKQIAERAVWIGNDETHYVRKWIDKDLQDLKSLVRLTVNFVDSEIEAEAQLASMPASKK